MRIVLVTPDLGGQSGWSRYALDLGRALSARGHELHCVVATEADAPWCRQYPILRQPTSYLGSVLLCFLHARTLSRALRTIRPDVVHVIAEPYALMLPFTRKPSWKEVLTIHGTYSVVPLTMGYKTARLARSYYARMDRIVAVSAFTKNYLASRFPSLADVAGDVTVVPNAISLAGIDADVAPRPKDRKLSILSVSGVKRKKGYVQSVRAVRAFLDAHAVPLAYDIVGDDAIDPSFTAELRSEIDRLGLREVVRLRGKLSDAELDEAYRAADLFLLPSLQEDDYFEGFGLVFVEANARGTPVIGGDTGGCPEAIKDGVSGYACDPEDVAGIARRMEDVLVRGTIERKACRTWAEEHDADDAAATIENVYAGL